MIELIVFLWIMLFLIFFIAGIVTNNPVFGIVAGVILLTFALGIIIDGLQFSSGMTINVVNGTQVVTTQYSEIASPFSTWGILFGLTLLAVSIYLFYANATEM